MMAGSRSLANPCANIASPAGRMVQTVSAGVAQFERVLIQHRTRSRRVAAKTCGMQFSDLPKLTAD